LGGLRETRKKRKKEHQIRRGAGLKNFWARNVKNMRETVPPRKKGVVFSSRSSGKKSRDLESPKGGKGTGTSLEARAFPKGRSIWREKVKKGALGEQTRKVSSSSLEEKPVESRIKGKHLKAPQLGVGRTYHLRVRIKMLRPRKKLRIKKKFLAKKNGCGKKNRRKRHPVGGQRGGGEHRGLFRSQKLNQDGIWPGKVRVKHGGTRARCGVNMVNEKSQKRAFGEKKTLEKKTLCGKTPGPKEKLSRNKRWRLGRQDSRPFKRYIGKASHAWRTDHRGQIS